MGDRFGDGEREVCARRARTGGLVVVAFVGKGRKGGLIASVGSVGCRDGWVPEMRVLVIASVVRAVIGLFVFEFVI